jgi:hypothetical protein
MKSAVSAELRAAVKARAAMRCEYCRMPEIASLFAHEVDHVIAEQHHGETTLENLASACFHCNRQKGPNIASIDLKPARLFVYSIRERTAGQITFASIFAKLLD